MPGPCWLLLAPTETLSLLLVGDASFRGRRSVHLAQRTPTRAYIQLFIFCSYRSSVRDPIWTGFGRVQWPPENCLRPVLVQRWSETSVCLLWWNCPVSFSVRKLPQVSVFVCLILPLATHHQRVERGQATGNGSEGPPAPVLRLLRSVPPGGTGPGGDGWLRLSAAGLESRRGRRERPVVARVWRPLRLRQHRVFWPGRFGSRLMFELMTLNFLLVGLWPFFYHWQAFFFFLKEKTLRNI